MLLVPLTVRQIHSMQTLQRHAPQMKEIQKKYKGDRQKMNEELMKFYKENNINPAASCLPMLAQIPVFFSLYFVLGTSRSRSPERRPRRGSHCSSRTSPSRRTRTGRAPAARRLRRQPDLSTLLMSTTMDKTQRT